MQTVHADTTSRPPIITVMGHIDHGKSTLLDYIRSTRITDTEAGGITQHISAYEVDHVLQNGEKRRITFLDTPGHEAFQHLRSRGSQAADLAILVVSADDGVKPQTLEALRAIHEAQIPFIVAITKIDKPNADIQRAKNSLLEHGIYLEGMGGDISYVPISSKTGEGVASLLDLLLLMADMEDLHSDVSKPAQGFVIESHCDPKRGISAVLVIQSGSLRAGEYVVAGKAYAPLRIMENCFGKKIREAQCSSPLLVVGFSDVPPVGSLFTTVPDKKTAVALVGTHTLEHSHEIKSHTVTTPLHADHFVFPIVIKADVVGSLEAIEHELRKHEDERTTILNVHQGIGTVSENDIKVAMADKKTVVIAFNVGVDIAARELAERNAVEIVSFSIIYNLFDWMSDILVARRPKITREVLLGTARILKCFSYTHKAQTIGFRVESGVLSVGDRIRITHAGEVCGTGVIKTLKSGRTDVTRIQEGNEGGAQVETNLQSEPGYGYEVTAYTTKES